MDRRLVLFATGTVCLVILGRVYDSPQLRVELHEDGLQLFFWVRLPIANSFPHIARLLEQL